MNFILRRLGAQTKSFLLIACLGSISGGLWAMEGQNLPLLGEDADGDGVRDDVAQFIDQQWRDPNLRKWAREAARGSQAYLISNGNAFALHRAHSFMERARRCLTETRDPAVANQVINRVLGVQLDNAVRKQQYKQAVDDWMYKVSHQNLPSQPDDDWTASCTAPRKAQPPQTLTQYSAGPAPASSTEELPPPNFFLNGGNPAAINRELPVASVEVRPLPDRSSAGQAEAADSDTTPAPRRWETYTPRRKAASRPPAASSLPVKKLRPGEPATIAEAANRQQAQTSRTPEQPRNNALPEELRSLAPFIRSIEQR